MPESQVYNPQDPRIHVDLAGLRFIGNRARGLSFLPRQPARSILNGRHASKVRGRGLNFEELRSYVNGDDVRTIDWKVTARTRQPHVRVYTEERDRPTLLIVDQRMSMFFGSTVYMKSVIAAEAAALAAHRVLAQGDRVGGLVFGDGFIAEHRPRRSRRALTQVLTSIAKANALLHAQAPVAGDTALNRVLKAAVRIAKTNGLILLFSDFDGIDDQTEPLVASLSQSNDVIMFKVLDVMADHLPKDMNLTVTDGSEQAGLDLSIHGRRIQEFLEARLSRVERWCRRYGITLLTLSTAEPAADQILRLMGIRAHR